MHGIGCDLLRRKFLFVPRVEIKRIVMKFIAITIQHPIRTIVSFSQRGYIFSSPKNNVVRIYEENSSSSSYWLAFDVEDLVESVSSWTQNWLYGCSSKSSTTRTFEWSKERASQFVHFIWCRAPWRGLVASRGEAIEIRMIFSFHLVTTIWMVNGRWCCCCANVLRASLEIRWTEEE